MGVLAEETQKTIDMHLHLVSNTNPNHEFAFAGLKIRVDVGTTPPSLLDVQVRCHKCLEPSFSPLELDESYPVLTNAFLIEGGDGYSILKETLTSRLPYGTDPLNLIVFCVLFIRNGPGRLWSSLAPEQNSFTSLILY